MLGKLSFTEEKRPQPRRKFVLMLPSQTSFGYYPNREIGLTKRENRDHE